LHKQKVIGLTDVSFHFAPFAFLASLIDHQTPLAKFNPYQTIAHTAARPTDKNRLSMLLLAHVVVYHEHTPQEFSPLLKAR
jgi:hypothetical protein